VKVGNFIIPAPYATNDNTKTKKNNLWKGNECMPEDIIYTIEDSTVWDFIENNDQSQIVTINPYK
jgi:hypothetical protein